MKNILVPTDFSVYAKKAALYASEIASNNGSKIYLLHVIEPVTDSIRQPYPLH
ncbi:MAG: universal stress protein [Chitinophagaceae bacterium]|nr:universal stress protein [Chitinophagaceae bacterium]